MSRPRVWLLASLLATAAHGWGGLPTLPITPGGRAIDPCDYSNSKAAQKAWEAGADTTPAAVATAGGRNVLRLTCRFAGSPAKRALWDRAVKLDLSDSRGIRFAFFCKDPGPVSYFSFYLKSGDGWYAASFDPKERTGWNVVTIEKSDTTIEGTPAGWGRIDAIRIAAWKGEPRNTECYVANVGSAGGGASIVLIRGDSVAIRNPDEAGAVARYCRGVATQLDRLGLDYSLLSDLDVTPERLKGRRLLVLPHNPSLPPAATVAIDAFLRTGGRLLAFYVLAPGLRDAAGIAQIQHMAPAYPGQFTSIRSVDGVLSGVPRITGQRSWNIYQTRPVQGRSRVAATWHDDKGAATGEPALVVSTNCLLMSHVLLEDDAASKRILLLAMIGHFVPDAWQQAAQRAVTNIGRFGPYDGAKQAEKALGRRARADAKLCRLVAQAAERRRAAGDAMEEGKYADALAGAEGADELLLLAYCGVQEAQQGEHRGLWCHSAFGVSGMTWDQAIGLLARNGFTTVFPNMAWGGVAYYHSEVLPVAPEVETRGDQIRECLAACRKYGIACHVWKVNWNMGRHATEAFRRRMVAEGRTQKRFSGRLESGWLCPSHPANQKLEIDAMVEVAKQYDVDGVHLDYIRYPGQDLCFCDGCRQRFEALAGHAVKVWPEDVRSDPKLQEQWAAFRRENITTVVRGVSEAARAIRPGIQISAAVFGNWTTDRESVAQDWASWCSKGYLDFVCPMDYTDSAPRFENMVRRQLPWAGRAACYPGIGLSTWRGGDDVCTLIEQIAITRRAKTGGFTVFEFDEPVARDVLPFCGMGITRREGGR